MAIPTDVGAAAFFSWEVPGKPFSVKWRLKAIDNIERDVLAAAANGREVCGILLGRVERPTRVIVVEDFEAAGAAFSTGVRSLYQSIDLAQVQKRFAFWEPAAPKRMYAVGLYRSNRKERPVLTQEDVDFAARCFPHRDGLFLLALPTAERTAQAALFLTDSGSFRPESSNAPFPLNRWALNTWQAPTGGPAVHPPTFDHGVRSQLSNELRPDSKHRSRRYVIAGLLLAAAGAAASLALMTHREPRDTGLERIKLAAQISHDQVELSWHAMTPSAADPIIAAHITVFDGPYRRQIELIPEEFRSGKLVYSPRTGDVSFTLDANGRAGHRWTASVAAPPFAQSASTQKVPAPKGDGLLDGWKAPLPVGESSPRTAAAPAQQFD